MKVLALVALCSSLLGCDPRIETFVSIQKRRIAMEKKDCDSLLSLTSGSRCRCHFDEENSACIITMFDGRKALFLCTMKGSEPGGYRQCLTPAASPSKEVMDLFETSGGK